MVPNGFQHVVGLGNFPSDWLVTTADEITEKITKGTTPPKSEIVNDRKIPFLRVNNLGFTGSLNSNSEMLFVTKDAHKGFLSRSIAYPNDILMNIVGPPLGKIAILGDEYPEYNMNQAVLIYRCKEQLIDNGYFLSFLGSELAQQWLQSRSKKTSGQQNLTIQLCKELPTPVPPLPEQRKIAKTLSTWDKAISTTEKLIETSKHQKKALMQQLLTGKKRLVNPETGKAFEGEWEEVKLSQLVKVTGGNAFKSEQFATQGIALIKISNIKPDYSISVDSSVFISEEPKYEKFKVQKGDVLIAMSGATTGKVGCYKFNQFSYLNQRVGRFDPKKNMVTRPYLFQLLKLSKVQHDILIDAVGGAQPNISNKDIERLKVLAPTINEQQKIASVLTAADKEIEVLEAKLAHFRQEKKALMQQLLTGKRRVKVDEEFAA
jgi:type I restriction enzyme S subunit